MAPLLNVAGGRVVTVATFYKATELIGHGRFAEVYKAFDAYSHTDVALKLYVGTDERSHIVARNEQAILETLGGFDSEYFPKLQRAAKHRIDNTSHPLLALELGSYVSDGQQRIVSHKEAIPPKNVSETESLVPDEAFWCAPVVVEWILHLVRAVYLLHSAGIIHRDLKPANILLKRTAAQTNAVPLLLDFNSATSTGWEQTKTGTPRYLPPEVRSGHRTEPSDADDLWAIALVAWETIFGADASLEDTRPHDWLRGDIPASLIQVLRRALLLRPEERFLNAKDFLAALDQVLKGVTSGAPLISSEEFAEARAAMGRMRCIMEEALAPQGELVVPKEIADSVATLFSWLAEEETESLNLVSELDRMGPKAIPCCLEQSYKLTEGDRTWREVLIALKGLAAKDSPLAQRSIELYALSSNICVRALCRGLCRAMEIFPDALLDSLTEDDGVLIPRERLELASLCISYSKNNSAILALSKYMCREYILNPGNYWDLRDKVAFRMGGLKFKDRARLIVEDTVSRLWDELPEYEKLSPKNREQIDGGLVELMADAFASMGDAALDVLRENRVPRSQGKIFRRFTEKLSKKHEIARKWLEEQFQRNPNDPDLKWMFSERQKEILDWQKKLEIYLASNSTYEFNELRFSQNSQEVFQLINNILVDNPADDTARRLLRLLRGFETRCRDRVVKCLLDHWALFEALDYAGAVGALTDYLVPAALHDEAVRQLNADLLGNHTELARNGLEKLLP